MLAHHGQDLRDGGSCLSIDYGASGRIGDRIGLGTDDLIAVNYHARRSDGSDFPAFRAISKPLPPRCRLSPDEALIPDVHPVQYVVEETPRFRSKCQERAIVWIQRPAECAPDIRISRRSDYPRP